MAVVVPTHNRLSRLIQCLQNVYAQEDVTPRVIVVFDGCTDGSQDAVRERFPEVACVEGDGSLWWSGAINAGICRAREMGADYVCLLNDDGRPQPGMLAALLRAAAENPGAIIGSKILCVREPNRIWCAGGLTDWLGSGALMRGNGQEDGPEWALSVGVDWFPGMGTLIPMSVIERVGLMDAERFPQYFGDVDFGLRAGRLGVRLLLCPDARLQNDVELTGVLLPEGALDWRTARHILFSLRSHAQFRTRWRFWRRHCPPALVLWQALRFYGELLPVMGKKLTWDRWVSPLQRLRRAAS